MFKNQPVPHATRAVSADSRYKGEHPFRLLLYLLYTCLELTESRPVPYAAPDSRVLRVHLPGACADMESFAGDFGPLLGEISLSLPVCVHGIAREYEEGTLRAEEGENGAFLLRQYSPAGEAFEALLDLNFKITLSSSLDRAFLEQLIHGITPEWGFIPMPRRWDSLPSSKGLYCKQPTMYYRYVSLLGEESCASEMVRFLTLHQMAALWCEFLGNGMVWEELERAWEQYEMEKDSGLCWLYRWEMALKLAVEQTGTHIEQEEGRLRVTDKNGRPIPVGYDEPSGAQKLFAKILYPV